MAGLLSAHIGSGSASTLLLGTPTSPRWIAVRQRFEMFQKGILLTPTQQLDGYTKRGGVVSCLNRYYYDLTSETDNSFFIGSWGKITAVRPPRDVDVYFLLSPAVYQRFEGYIYSKQSSLLQEVTVLSLTYPNTDMRGDGQVVMVKFESYSVEVVPAFQLEGGGYWICDTNDGGSYKRTNPWVELNHIESVDNANAKNLRPLIRMLKVWQAYCSVPIKSFQLELVAADFLAQSPWRLNDYFYFDWLCRDFFAYLYHRANSYVSVPGTAELVSLGDAWRSRAEAAYHRAVKACNHEGGNRVTEAGDEWQKLFGAAVPRSI